MKKGFLIGTEGEVLVADGQSVRVVTTTHVITVVGGDGARVSVEPFRGGARIAAALMERGMDVLDAAFRSTLTGRVAGCKPLSGLARVRVAYDVLVACGYVSGYGSQAAFIRAAVRRGWWVTACTSHVHFKSSALVLRDGDRWIGPEECAALASAFAAVLE